MEYQILMLVRDPSLEIYVTIERVAECEIIFVRSAS